MKIKNTTNNTTISIKMNRKQLEERLAELRNFLEEKIEHETKAREYEGLLGIGACSRLFAYKAANEELRQLFPQIDFYGSIEQVKY